MADGVAEVDDAAACLYVISSTSLSHDQPLKPYGAVGHWNLRFQSNNISHKLTLVPPICAHLPGPIQQTDSGHILIRSEVDFAGEVVNMSNQGCHYLSKSWVCLWSRRCYHRVCEGWVIFNLGCAVDFDGVHLCCGPGRQLDCVDSR